MRVGAAAESAGALCGLAAASGYALRKEFRHRGVTEAGRALVRQLIETASYIKQAFSGKRLTDRIFGCMLYLLKRKLYIAYFLLFRVVEVHRT